MFLQHFKNPEQSVDLTSVDIINWLALAQHHNEGQRYPTRLIDITTDPYVGLYFAVSRNFDSPGYVFVFDCNFNDLDSGGKIATQGGTFVDILKIDGNDGLPYHPQENTLNLLRPPFPNERLETQSGLSIWNRAIGENYSTGGFPFEIPAANKHQVLSALETRGYDKKILFP